MRRTQLSKFTRAALVPMVAAGLSFPVLAADSAGSDHAGSQAGTAAPAGAKAGARTTKSSPSGSASTSASTHGQSSDTRDLRASELIGMSVRNPKGNNIGQIDDLVVDLHSGEVRYAMLRFDPGIMSAEKLFAVPTTELRMAQDRDDLVYDMSEKRLEQASVDRKDWNARWLRDGDRMAKLNKVWGIKQPSENAAAHRASDLIGKDVNDRKGDKIGEIEELVVDMAHQKVHYAVMAFDPSWTSPEKNYAIPLKSFRLAKDKDELTLDIDKSKLASMKSFTDDRYARLNDRAWVTDVDSYLVTMTPLSNVETAQDARTTASSGTASGGAMGSGTSASADPVFGQLDKDHNGWLDRSETKAQQDVDGQWSGLDQDHDGRVTRDEFSSQYKAGQR